MIRYLFDWIICGYRPGHNRAISFCCYWGMGWSIGLDTRRGRFVSWFLNFTRAVKEGPRTFRLWRADRLSRKAMKLRGQKPVVFGFYDVGRGNEAAKLKDDVWCMVFDFWWKLKSNDLMDDEGEDNWTLIEEKLVQLAQLAGASWERNCTNERAEGSR